MPHRSRQRVAAARQFLSTTDDVDPCAADRHDHVCRMLADTPPDQLTDGELIVILELLEPVYHRVTGTTINDGAPVVPRARQLCQVMATITPDDLSADDVTLLASVLIPAHARVLDGWRSRGGGPGGRPLQRLLPTRIYGFQFALQFGELAT